MILSAVGLTFNELCCSGLLTVLHWTRSQSDNLLISTRPLPGYVLRRVQSITRSGPVPHSLSSPGKRETFHRLRNGNTLSRDKKPSGRSTNRTAGRPLPLLLFLTTSSSPPLRLITFPPLVHTHVERSVRMLGAAQRTNLSAAPHTPSHWPHTHTHTLAAFTLLKPAGG